MSWQHLYKIDEWSGKLSRRWLQWNWQELPYIWRMSLRTFIQEHSSKWQWWNEWLINRGYGTYYYFIIHMTSQFIAYCSLQFWNLLGNFTLGFHAAVTLNKILLAAKNWKWHEQLSNNCWDSSHSDCWIHVKAVNKQWYQSMLMLSLIHI